MSGAVIPSSELRDAKLKLRDSSGLAGKLLQCQCLHDSVFKTAVSPACQAGMRASLPLVVHVALKP